MEEVVFYNVADYHLRMILVECQQDLAHATKNSTGSYNGIVWNVRSPHMIDPLVILLCVNWVSSQNSCLTSRHCSTLHNWGEGVCCSGTSKHFHLQCLQQLQSRFVLLTGNLVNTYSQDPQDCIQFVHIVMNVFYALLPEIQLLW